MRWVLLSVAVACGSSCAFNPTGTGAAGRDGGASDAATIIDGSTADAAIACAAGELECHGRQLRTCNATGDGYASIVDCDFACGERQCRSGSNLGAEAFASCGAEAPSLSPPDDATVVISGVDDAVEITCSPHCGDGATTTITGTGAVTQGGGNRAVAYVCLGDLNLPPTVTMTTAGQIVPVLAFIVHREAAIGGTIDVSGRAALDNQGGAGGPGAGNGAQPNVMNDNGFDGSGPRPGRGGLSSLSQVMDTAAGGGGGGAFGGVGGQGGLGRNDAHDELGFGGAAGNPPTGNGTLGPLVAGSGGGGGADSECTGGPCGFPGGGGGGALQISARLRIVLSLSGAIRADGGDGYGASGAFGKGGGGGGGSGGGVLLEAPIVQISGKVSVEGGAGGRSGAGLGGAGAAGASPNGFPGTDAQNGGGNGAGGAGGGGGGGRIRLNALSPPSCDTIASPADLCTTAPL